MDHYYPTRMRVERRQAKAHDAALIALHLILLDVQAGRTNLTSLASQACVNWMRLQDHADELQQELEDLENG